MGGVDTPCDAEMPRLLPDAWTSVPSVHGQACTDSSREHSRREVTNDLCARLAQRRGSEWGRVAEPKGDVPQFDLAGCPGGWKGDGAQGSGVGGPLWGGCPRVCSPGYSVAVCAAGFLCVEAGTASLQGPHGEGARWGAGAHPAPSAPPPVEDGASFGDPQVQSTGVGCCSGEARARRCWCGNPASVHQDQIKSRRQFWDCVATVHQSGKSWHTWQSTNMIYDLGLLWFLSLMFYISQHTNFTHFPQDSSLSIQYFLCYCKWYYFKISNYSLLIYRNKIDICILTFILWPC